MKELKPCPCGETPTKLHITDAGQGGKWALASGDCCGEWIVEFRTGNYALDHIKCYRRGMEYWNDAPRGGKCK